MDGETVIAIVTAIAVIFISVTVLKWLFIAAKKLLGLIGVLIASAIPGTITYLITHAIFGFGVSEASIPAIGTALLVAAIANIITGGHAVE